MDDREQLNLQMMAFIDDELSDEDRRAFIERCFADPELAEELARYRRLAEIASSMQLREPEDYEYERFFARLSARLERRLGFALLAAGLVILLGAGLWALVCSTLPLGVKVGAAVSLCGLALLVSSVARMRLRLRRLDRYQGVRR